MGRADPVGNSAKDPAKCLGMCECEGRDLEVYQGMSRC